eukprot:CAMPEP_0172319218 /NCGR_PEP_ID=MMETSP1058-20130122/37097_1 /TAXON_ID=83371 /ORGANISM="Detonula confervacea, Strain CCMP 353" /LENGTH=308 /DNA_ID=CAMNT_0013034217 /DNA_START=118 /DNA_END=1044 /DNA_ORIENTATION=-
MATPPTTSNHPNSGNIPIATSAIDVHLHNLQSNIPPNLRSLCFPHSTSAFLRNMILTNATLNLLLFPSSLLSIGVRYMGFDIVLISFTSCFHMAIICMVLGNHIADTVSSSSFTLLGNNNNNNLGPRLANTLRNTSLRYGSNVFLYGALFGSTVVMAMLMHVVHVYYGGIADCVVTNAANAASNSRSGSGAFHLTGGYANDDHSSNTSGSTMAAATTAFDPFTICGASGPVKLVSFLSSLLVWSNAILAVTLYAKREELLSGGGGGAGSFSSSNQYDEIGGVATQPPNGGGFAGDFPPEQQDIRTTQV